MTLPFRIKRTPEGTWVPAHPEIENPPYFTETEGSPTPFAAIRESLWGAVDAGHPGEYELDDNLDNHKQYVFSVIDEGTDKLIDKGMTFSGSVFSLSIYAQARYVSMLTAKQYLGYPLEINSLDDNTSVSLTNETEVVMFCLTALAYVRDQVDSGTVLKDQVRVATTVEDLEAIVDTRS